jgi:iron complex outermembrane receptor protein
VQNTADCALITRDQVSGNITSVNTFSINDQRQNTRGVDYEISYIRDLEGSLHGTLSLRLFATEVIHLTTLGVERAGEIGNNTSTPRWRGNLSAAWQLTPWTFFGQVRYIGSGTYDNTYEYTANAIADNDISSRTYFDATVQYQFQLQSIDRLQVFGRVVNLLDKDPPVIGNGNVNAAPTNTALYDTAGRTFIVGLRVDF